jgi:hypothetical protein
MSTSVQPFKVGDRVIYNWLADDRFFEGDDPTKPFTKEIEIGTVKVLLSNDQCLVRWDSGKEECVPDYLLCPARTDAPLELTLREAA